MSCKVICCECMNFLHLTFNICLLDVLPKRLKQSSQFIMHPSNFCLNTRVKQLVVDVEDSFITSLSRRTPCIFFSSIQISWIPYAFKGFKVCFELNLDHFCLLGQSHNLCFTGQGGSSSSIE